MTKEVKFVKVPVEDYENLVESNEILSNSKTIKSIERSLKEIGKGQWHSAEEL